MNKFYSNTSGRSTLADAKARLNIHMLWIHFGFPDKPSASCRCPWREDHKPSFSVFDDGNRWNDFATGEAGDVVDFFQRATGLSKKDACQKFIELAGGNVTSMLRAARHQPKLVDIKPRPQFLNFRKGTRADLIQLAQFRGIGREGLEWASERGLLWFATLHRHPAWVITDTARVNAQARRMDGQGWEHLPACPKAYTLPGSWASWPLGIEEAQPFSAVALCEGGPDFLAAHYLVLWEQAPHPSKRDVRCAPVAMLGANLRIHENALPMFVGKRVRIFGHADEAGHTAVEAWARQLETIGADVDAFDFTGLVQVNGEPVKDLNDALMMDVNSFTQADKILP